MTSSKAVLPWLILALAFLAGCSASPSHLAYVSLPQSNSIGAFRINNSSGKFTSIVGSPFLAGNSPGPVIVAPSTDFLYVANRTDGTISLFKIDKNIGSLTEVPPRVSTGVAPNSMVMDAGGKFLFAANQISRSISVYTINSGSGVLTEVGGSPFPTPPDPVSLAVTSNGNFLYVVNSNLQLVFGYAVASDGTLSAVPGAQFAVGTGAFAIAVDPNDKFVYVANSTENTVSIFSIAATGALTPITSSPFPTGTTPLAIALSPSGQYLYIANHGSNNVTAYSIDSSTGAPTAITGSPFGATSQAVSLVADPNGKVLYVLGQSATINTLSITSSSGVLTTGTQTATAPSDPVSMFVTK